MSSGSFFPSECVLAVSPGAVCTFARTRPSFPARAIQTSPSEVAASDSPVATRKQSDSLQTLRQLSSFGLPQLDTSRLCSPPARLKEASRRFGHAILKCVGRQAMSDRDLGKPGMRRPSAGRLATVRSWPALTASPAAMQRRLLFRIFPVAWRPLPNHRGKRHTVPCRARRGRRRCRAPRPCRPGRDRQTAKPGSRPSSGAARSARGSPPGARNPSHGRRSPAPDRPGTSVTWFGWLFSTRRRKSSLG